MLIEITDPHTMQKVKEFGISNPVKVYAKERSTLQEFWYLIYVGGDGLAAPIVKDKLLYLSKEPIQTYKEGWPIGYTWVGASSCREISFSTNEEALHLLRRN